MDPDGFREAASFTINLNTSLPEVDKIMKIVKESNLDVVGETKIFECLLQWLNVKEEPGRKQYGLYLMQKLKTEKIAMDDWKRNFRINKELLDVDLIRSFYINTIISKLREAKFFDGAEWDHHVSLIRLRFSLPLPQQK